MKIDKRTFDLVKDFGTSKSPKLTRSSMTNCAPAALRPLSCDTPRWFASQDNSRKWLDAMFGWLLCFPFGACARRVNSAPSSLLATTHLRFALLGAQRQRETWDDRAAGRADRIRDKLGWEAGIFNGNGWKPKGMHWNTFERLTAQHDAFVQASLAGMAERLNCMEIIGRLVFPNLTIALRNHRTLDNADFERCR